MSESSNSISTAAQTILPKASDTLQPSESPSRDTSRGQCEVSGNADDSDLDTLTIGADVSNTISQSGESPLTVVPTQSSQNYSFELQFDTFQLPTCARNCESVHTVKCHQKELCKSLYALYKDAEYCDATIRCGSRTIQCHKLVLVCVSGYFRSMFGSGMRESVENAVELRDLPDDAVASLVDFAYSGQIVLSTDNVQRLLFAASVLQIEPVCVACDAFVRRHLTTSNCVGIRTFAELHGRFELIQAVDTFIADHFSQIVNQSIDDFLSMNEASLSALLSQANLNAPNEQAIYEAILRWTHFDLDSRRISFERLAALIRFGQLPTEFLLESVCNEPLIQSSVDCLRYIDEAKTFKLAQSFLPSYSPRVAKAASASASASSAYSNSNQGSIENSNSISRCLTGSVRCTPRRSYAGVIFCVGGRGSTGEPYRSVECYNPVDNSWIFIAEMTSKRRHVGVISCNGRLYAIGGHDGVEHLNTGEVYDPKVNRWMRIANMSTKRRGLALASIGTAIYALGGLDDSTCMSAVERYNITTDQWTNVAPMSVPRGGVACVVFANHIYAAGGNDGTNSVDSCEVFDPVLDKWSNIAPMHYKRAGAGIAALHEYVYVVGGFDNDLPLDSVEQYDFRTNVWNIVTRMGVCRGGAGLAALANRLYTVGGHDGSDYLLSVECFDPVEKRWINDVANISVSRAGAGVTSCDVPIRVIIDALETSQSQSASNGGSGNTNASVSQAAYGLQHMSISSSSGSARSGNSHPNQSSRGNRSHPVTSSSSSSSTPISNAHVNTHGGVVHSNGNVVTGNNSAFVDDANVHQLPDWPSSSSQQCAPPFAGASTSASCVYHCNSYQQPAYQNMSDVRQCTASGANHASTSGSGLSTHQRQHAHHSTAMVASAAASSDAAASPTPSNVVYVCPYHQQLAKSSSSRQRPSSAAASSSSAALNSNQHSFDQD